MDLGDLPSRKPIAVVSMRRAVDLLIVISLVGLAYTFLAASQCGDPSGRQTRISTDVFDTIQCFGYCPIFGLGGILGGVFRACLPEY
jgi:hypothetical protein